MNTQSMTYIITAPSGTGKSTINRRLVKDIENLEFSVSYTTRDRRPDEINGIHYWFIEQKEFKKLIQQKEMLEWAEVFGNFYGTSQLEINRIISQRKEALLEIDVQGWLTLKKSVNPLCSLFILPPWLRSRPKTLLPGSHNARKTAALACAPEWGCTLA